MENYWIAPGAPDVHIYLTSDRDGDVRVAEVIDFGRITQLTGIIQFSIPADVDMAKIQSVVVYSLEGLIPRRSAA